MRKKSHISLAGQIMDSLELEQVFDYKLPFYVGSIWPDCRPSFITTPHRFDNTYTSIEEKLNRFVDDYDEITGMNMRRCAKLGVIIHYIADYFTFPHNNHYDGNVKDHCFYERDLKHQLKAYLKTETAQKTKEEIQPFSTTSELTDFIQKTHAEYMKLKKTVEEDIQYIVKVCTTVVMSIIHMVTYGYEALKLNLQYI